MLGKAHFLFIGWKISELLKTLICLISSLNPLYFMHLSQRVGGTPAFVGHLISIAFSTLENLTKNLGPRVGTFVFFARRNSTKSHF